MLPDVLWLGVGSGLLERGVVVHDVQNSWHPE